MNIWQDARTRVLLAALAILAVFAFGVHIARGQMMASADALVAQAENQAAEAAAQLDEQMQEIKAAKKNHLTRHTKNLSTASEEEALSAARDMLLQANDANDPTTKRVLAAKASEALTRASQEREARHAYIVLLDEAKKDYKEDPTRLSGSIESATRYIDGLVAEGYFEQHFARSRAGLADAAKLQGQANELLAKVVESGLPDYLEIHRVCGSGLTTTAQAKQLAGTVPATRRINEEQASRLTSRVTSLNMSYNSALVAAVTLERYAPYRILDRVEAANAQLEPLRRRIQEAQHQNSMESQRFTEAAAQLSSIERELALIDQLFAQATQSWEKVKTAIAAIPSSRGEAAAAVERAVSHKNAYSENSQTSAEQLIAQARASYSSGERLATVDPPQSLGEYANAKSYANQAYDAVDTADHSYHPSSSSDTYDYGGSTIGGGSTYGGSSGGGSYGGGSSGGGYGGPSGGGYGGPSGGGYGSGGF